MTVLGYVRVSTEKQDPESQIALLKAKGIPSDCIFVDEGISGWTDPLVRPTYKRMMKRVDDPNLEKVTGIVFSEFSRIGRNAMEGLAELTRLEHKGIVIQSLSAKESFLNEIPSPWQGFILHGMMVGAELERAHHRERTQIRMDQFKAGAKTKSGKKVGRPSIEVDWDEIAKTKAKYGISENMAAKICGYRPSTFYKCKKAKSA